MSYPNSTPTPNSLLEALAVANLSGAQANILFRLIRDTLGWEEDPETKRRVDRIRISNRELAERTCLQLRTVQDGLKGLVERRIILQYQQGKGRAPSVYGINPDHTQWDLRGTPVPSVHPKTRSTTKNRATTNPAVQRSVTENRATTERSTTENRVATDGLPESRGTENRATTDPLLHENPYPSRSASPDGYGAEVPSKINSLNKKTPIVPLEGTELDHFLSMGYGEQLHLLDMTTDTALSIMEHTYHATLGQKVKTGARKDGVSQLQELKDFLELKSRNKAALAAMFAKGCEQAVEDHHARLANPETAPYVKKDPFGDAMRFARLEYQKFNFKSRSSKPRKMHKPPEPELSSVHTPAAGGGV